MRLEYPAWLATPVAAWWGYYHISYIISYHFTTFQHIISEAVIQKYFVGNIDRLPCPSGTSPELVYPTDPSSK